MSNTTYIEVNLENTGRPKERPPKANWVMEMTTRILRVMQHVLPGLTVRIIWYFFGRPGKANFTKWQTEIVDQAVRGSIEDRGDKLATYQWGDPAAPKVLLVQGWRSKMADFKRIIDAYVAEGYCVEGWDMRAHGHSAGEHTSLPDFCRILSTVLLERDRYELILGYSMGASAVANVLSELPKEKHPDQVFLLAAPPNVEPFFEEALAQAGCNQRIYDRLMKQIKVVYGHGVEYYDLRTKTDRLDHLEKHFVYCENDTVVPFEAGRTLFGMHKRAHLLHAKGFGHYKLIARPEIIQYLVAQLRTNEPKEEAVLVG